MHIFTFSKKPLTFDNDKHLCIHHPTYHLIRFIYLCLPFRNRLKCRSQLNSSLLLSNQQPAYRPYTTCTPPEFKLFIFQKYSARSRFVPHITQSATRAQPIRCNLSWLSCLARARNPTSKRKPSSAPRFAPRIHPSTTHSLYHLYIASASLRYSRRDYHFALTDHV